MTVRLELDLDTLKREIRKTYAQVSAEPGHEFIFFRTARQSRSPGSRIPLSLGLLERGEQVLDLGSGAGTDALVAAQMVGPKAVSSAST